MGGRGAVSSGTRRGGFQIQQTPPQLQPNQQAQQQANLHTFPATDDRQHHDLVGGRNYFLSQNVTADGQVATINYLSPNPETGSQYSMSQNMNHALDTGQPLTANQKYVYDNLMANMHNLGENLNLTRYDHSGGIDNILHQAGLKGTYSDYIGPNGDISLLKQYLVGKTYRENKILSTSTNDFKNAGSSAQTFTSRPIKYNYKANADVQGFMTGNGPAGALGEMILAPSGKNKNFKIVDVRLTGNMARKKGTQSYSLPQIEIITEVEKQK